MPSSACDWSSDVCSSDDRKSTRLNSSHDQISYAVFCLKKKIVIVGRTHGHHAVVITLGLKFAFWLEGLRRYQHRIKQVQARSLFSMYLGIIGNVAGLRKHAL